MEVIGSSQSSKQVDAQALAVAVFKDEKVNEGVLQTLDEAVDGLISRVIQSEGFAGKAGETAYFHVMGKGLRARRLLLIGCGDRDGYKAAQISQMAGTATRFLRSKNAKAIAIVPRTDAGIEKTAQNVIVGAIMGLFEPDKYRTQDKEERKLESSPTVHGRLPGSSALASTCWTKGRWKSWGWALCLVFPAVLMNHQS